MFAKGQTVIGYLEELAPKHYAVPEDRIGLQVGTLQKEIKKCMVTLEVTEAVVDEAVELQIDLIIAHHAVIFRPLQHIQTDSPLGRMIRKLIKHDIAVYIAHTNLDVAEGGVNDLMANALGLTQLSPLDHVHTEKLKKCVVFVPESHHEQVLQAMFHAGAGHIGNYSHCSFNMNGTGTFLAGEGTEPYIGKEGKFERVQEIRIETIVPESRERRVIQAMLKAHPYEEVAYDIYPMDLKGRTFGIGRVGELPQPMPLTELVSLVKHAYEVPMVRIVGKQDKLIKKVAVLGGSGSRYIRHAIFAGADVLITGDVDYHSAQVALAQGISIIDPGHHVEKIMKPAVAGFLDEKLKENKYDTEILISAVDTEPFQFF